MPKLLISRDSDLALIHHRPAITRLNSDGVLQGLLSGEALCKWVVKTCLVRCSCGGADIETFESNNSRQLREGAAGE